MDWQQALNARGRIVNLVDHFHVQNADNIDGFILAAGNDDSLGEEFDAAIDSGGQLETVYYDPTSQIDQMQASGFSTNDIKLAFGFSLVLI